MQITMKLMAAELGCGWSGIFVLLFQTLKAIHFECAQDFPL